MKNSFSNIKPILSLFILSPLIAELLFGSTPASRSFQLIFETFFYGSGVLLIREIARRRGLGWISIILLGIAFGIIEECILLQTAFNPNFLGNDLTFGRAGGVNWVWAEYIIGYHAIWSITIPILITELIFHSKSTRPWLSKTGIGITAVIYLLSCVAFYSTFVKMTGFTTSFVHYSIAGILALSLIVLSLWLPNKMSFKSFPKTPSLFVIGVVAFAGSASWLGFFSLLFKQGAGLSPWMVELSGLLIVMILYFLISGCVRQNWNNTHRFSLAFGGLMASMVFGLITLVQAGNQLDIICQMIFILITTVLMVLLKKRLLKSEAL
ncbi:MAG TPA: hypothetical protein VFC67_11095 [Prolixibacteraceae bacterium]|nr:hypothetical protein [Prolixibacteraceae bacterium]